AAVFLVLPAVVTFERGSAISRCFALFHRDLGASISRIATIFGLSLGVGIVAALIGEVIDLVIGGTQSLGDGLTAGSTECAATRAVRLVAGAVVSGLLEAAAAVFTATLTLTAYADMRARVETLSTATLASELGIAAQAAPEWGVSPAA